MKKLFSCLLFIAFLLLFPTTNSTAQDTEIGIVTYEQIIDYGLKPRGKPRWDNFIADLPKTGKAYFNLSFNSEQALFLEDESMQEAPNPQLQRALKGVNWGKAPQPKLKQVHYDFKKNKKTEQFEFMTRNFLIQSDIENKAWKLTNNKKQVLDYVCMGAELEVGNTTITAWFTPEIPVSIGPNIYHGLPGLILGLEKEGEIFMLATSIGRNVELDKESLAKPKAGAKMSQEEFDKVVAEKTEEHKQMIEAKKKARGGTDKRG